MRLVVLLTLLALGASAPNAGAEEIEVKPRLNGGIRGRVIALDTGVAIKLAYIDVKGSGMGAATSEDGSFKIENVPPGVYTLEITAPPSYDPVEVRGVSVLWTQVTEIPMPLGLPKTDPRRHGLLVIELGDMKVIAELLKGSLPPRLPAEKPAPEAYEVTRLQAGPRPPRTFRYPWVHRLPITREELRSSHLQDQRLERASVTWTEAWRRRLE